MIYVYEFFMWAIMFIWSRRTVKKLEDNDLFLEEWSDKNAKN